MPPWYPPFSLAAAFAFLSSYPQAMADLHVSQVAADALTPVMTGEQDRLMTTSHNSPLSLSLPMGSCTVQRRPHPPYRASHDELINDYYD